MTEAVSPIPPGMAGLVMPSEIDGHPVTIALARRGPRQVEAILSDGPLRLYAKADLLLNAQASVMDVLMGSLVSQYSEHLASQQPVDVWSLIRGDA